MDVGFSSLSPFILRFNGWRNSSPKGNIWIQHLCSKYQFIWKQAGIYEAIMSSKYPISRHDGLILALASRWCRKTNTFKFPWGEVTITLEDVMILGGFSTLGVRTLSPPENDVNLLNIEERLKVAKKEVQKSKSKKAALGVWLDKFMGSDDEDLEHIAFLVFWLSRFVFPVGSSWIIKKRVYRIAIQLSRGIKFALARPVLAMLYNELTALNKTITENSLMQLDLFALFHILQVWAWERVPLIRPTTNPIYSSGSYPRAARWSKVIIFEGQDLKYAIDSAEDTFVWCPYNGYDKDESFFTCIEASKLQGFGIIQKYEPQRVARQFGLVQDIPTDISEDLTNQVAFKDGKLYVKSTLCRPTVTPRYQPWWEYYGGSPSGRLPELKVENGIDYGRPPGFPPRILFVTIDG